MTGPQPHKRRIRFSLGQLLIATTFIAICIAVTIAYQKSKDLLQQRSQLRALSSRLEVEDETRLQMSAMPRVTYNLQSWNVHVPAGQPHDLRLAIGDVSSSGMPNEFEAVSLTPGQHRLTLHAAEQLGDGYHYVVYVDGQVVFDRSMGSEWMPNGWRQASGLNLPPSLRSAKQAPLQIAGRNYTPRFEKRQGFYLNVQRDDWVTAPGYRLWIDQRDSTYPPPSPFLGHIGDPMYNGIGLRDGLRLRSSNTYEWHITRPSAGSRDAALRIIPEFHSSDGTLLSDQDPAFTSWQRHDDAISKGSVSWKRDDQLDSHSVFLHAILKPPSDTSRAVCEMKWDRRRPDEVAIRLADVPANQSITRWRLNVAGGQEHLWRIVKVGDRTIDVRKDFSKSELSANAFVPIELPKSDLEHVGIRWKTDVTGPLQYLRQTRKRPNPYSGIKLFEGLPLQFGVEVPESMKATLAIKPSVNLAQTQTAIPGGPVAERLAIELNEDIHQWIWFRAASPSESMTENSR